MLKFRADLVIRPQTEWSGRVTQSFFLGRVSCFPRLNLTMRWIFWRLGRLIVDSMMRLRAESRFLLSEPSRSITSSSCHKVSCFKFFNEFPCWWVSETVHEVKRDVFKCRLVFGHTDDGGCKSSSEAFFFSFFTVRREGWCANMAAAATDRHSQMFLLFLLCADLLLIAAL